MGEGVADVIIVGGGLVGSLASKLLKEKGLSTIILDSTEPLAASKCCFGLWKEGWVNKSIYKEYEEGQEILYKYTGEPEEITLLNLDKEEEQTFLRISPKLILNEETLPLRVQKVKNRKVIAAYEDGEKTVLLANKAVLIAAGAFTQSILENSGYTNAPQIDLCYGASIHAKAKVEENRILQWAPYRQSILLKDGKNKVMFGDGFVVKHPKPSDPRVKLGSERLVKHFNEIMFANVSNENITEIREGYRPYLKKGTPSFINLHDTNLLSATGGAKNTMILAGHMAKQIYLSIKKMKR